MNRGAWWATVRGVTKSRTQLSNLTHTHYAFGGLNFYRLGISVVFVMTFVSDSIVLLLASSCRSSGPWRKLKVTGFCFFLFFLSNASLAFYFLEFHF